MISHLSDCIEKKFMVGYGGLLTWIFKKFGVPLNGLQFLMSANKKIGAKCLTNLLLKVSDKGILEEASNEDVEEENSEEKNDEEEEKQQNEGEEKEKEKEDQKNNKEDQKPVPTATNDEAEGVSKGEPGEAVSEGETSEEKEGEDLDNDNSSDEEVRMPIQKKPIVTPRKSIRLAFKGERLVVRLNDDSSTHTSHEPKQSTPPSLKPNTSPSQQIPSPPPSPIPCTPPPNTTPKSPGLGFTGFANPSISADLSSINCRFFSLSFTLFKMRFVSSLHHSLISLHK